MTTVFTLRPAHIDDESYIKECFRACTREDRHLKRPAYSLGPYFPAAEKDAIEKMEDGDWQNEVVLAVTKDGTPIGFGRIYHRCDELSTLHKLYVDPDHRGKGVAGTLVNHFATTAEYMGSKQIMATVPAVDLMPFYEKIGFKYWVSRPSTNLGKPDLVLVKRDLTP